MKKVSYYYLRLIRYLFNVFAATQIYNMRFQKIFLLVCLLFAGDLLMAQQIQFAQALGLTGTTSNVSGRASTGRDSLMINSDYQLRLRRFGIIYQARTELMQWKGGTISIASPAMIGFSISSRYNSVDVSGGRSTKVDSVKGAHIAFEIPVIAELNIGLHSAADESGRFGIYIGGGYTYSYTKIHTSVGVKQLDGIDPILRAGIRMGKSWETRWGLAFTMRGRTEASRTYGIQLLKEL